MMQSSSFEHDVEYLSGFSGGGGWPVAESEHDVVASGLFFCAVTTSVRDGIRCPSPATLTVYVPSFKGGKAHVMRGKMQLASHPEPGATQDVADIPTVMSLP